jgi:hypothetical protein
MTVFDDVYVVAVACTVPPTKKTVSLSETRTEAATPFCGPVGEESGLPPPQAVSVTKAYKSPIVEARTSTRNAPHRFECRERSKAQRDLRRLKAHQGARIITK